MLRLVMMMIAILFISALLIEQTTCDVETFRLPARVRSPSPLAFSFDHALSRNEKTGEIIWADSKSLWINSTADGQGSKRWFPIAGEIHPGRVPSKQWRNELTKMKAGGLNTISVYVFWIYHEEERNKFIFDGRRDIRSFLQLAASLDLKVLLRIGPWDHGECRNGGHPDWVLTQCGKLRSSDPAYLSCVEDFYRELGAQVEGLFWRDGGPVFAIQLDNETSDWKYLLALKAIASKYFSPAYFAKTGWPAPADAPANLPLMPYFGGYPDLFWTNDMHPDPASSAYRFSNFSTGKSLPYLGIEIGGGMATAYNHRVHLESDDLPSLHLVDVGSGYSSLGYYMFHGSYMFFSIRLRITFVVILRALREFHSSLTYSFLFSPLRMLLLLQAATIHTRLPTKATIRR